MMHVNDISKLKSFGNYNVDIPIASLKGTLSEWIEDYNLELNPYFQRGRVWTVDQQIAFVEFLLRGGKCPPLLFNHPGWMGAFEGNFYCVDGLQRISALLDFIGGNLPVFNGHYIDQIDGINRLLKSTFIRLYINDLKTDREVLEWYLELNGGGTPHTQEELNRVRDLLEQLN